MPTPVPPPLPPVRAKTWFERNWVWMAVLGGAALLAAFGISAWLGLGWINKHIKESEGYRLAMATVRADAKVRAALGEPIEDQGIITGSFSDSGRRHMVFARVPLRGPHGHGILTVNASQIDGPWQFTILAVTVESTQQRIDLRAAAREVLAAKGEVPRASNESQVGSAGLAAC